MHRRDFLASSLSALAVAPAAASAAVVPGSTVPRQFYDLRKYTLSSGPVMGKVTEAYVADALIPALNRMGIAPVGAFHLDYGPETPALYVLIPAASAEALVYLDYKLAEDPVFTAAAEPFHNAPASAPPFHRIESSLLLAFEGFPSLHIPVATASKGKRIFQLRTYESPTQAAHLRKVDMFHHGEFDFFRNAGCEAVFYSQTVIGPRMPSLTYMLTFKDLAALQAGWAAFSADPAWIKLKSEPRYTDPIVSNISNLILSPTPYSQI
jgi:hypothetical protein